MNGSECWSRGAPRAWEPRKTGAVPCKRACPRRSVSPLTTTEAEKGPQHSEPADQTGMLTKRSLEASLDWGSSRRARDVERYMLTLRMPTWSKELTNVLKVLGAPRSRAPVILFSTTV